MHRISSHLPHLEFYAFTLPAEPARSFPRFLQVPDTDKTYLLTTITEQRP